MQRYTPWRGNQSVWGLESHVPMKVLCDIKVKCLVRMRIRVLSIMDCPTGGYGWIINWNRTAPRSVVFEMMEIDPESIMLISIPYPTNTKLEIVAVTTNCQNSSSYSCTSTFRQVATIQEVRDGPGDTYHVDLAGVLTFRLAQLASNYIGQPSFSLPNYTTPARFARDVWALRRFERDGVRLPGFHYYTSYRIQATCPSDTGTSPKTGHCPESVPIYDPEVCPSNYIQTAYDKCCQSRDKTKCIWADESKNF
jgi:hypothetical protein